MNIYDHINKASKFTFGRREVAGKKFTVVIVEIIGNNTIGTIKLTVSRYVFPEFDMYTHWRDGDTHPKSEEGESWWNERESQELDGMDDTAVEAFIFGLEMADYDLFSEAQRLRSAMHGVLCDGG